MPKKNKRPMPAPTIETSEAFRGTIPATKENLLALAEDTIRRHSFRVTHPETSVCIEGFSWIEPGVKFAVRLTLTKERLWNVMFLLHDEAPDKVYYLDPDDA